jgi:deoxyribodipyrimidine photo-lyase
MQNPIHIVWFKRDLRVHDHAPLVAACQAGYVLPLFCWEPTVCLAPDYAAQHQNFVVECLAELSVELKKIGLELQVSNAGIIETLNAIAAKIPIAALYSHEETGNGATYAVDKQVAVWCKQHQVTWHETPQNGVVRRLKNRDHWQRHWEARMSMSLLKKPAFQQPATPYQLPSHLAHFNRPIAAGVDKPYRQRGGYSLALETLTSFLDGRAAKFRGGISSPLSAVSAGSRLSPYLAYGCLSMREVVQASRERQFWANEAPHLFSKSLSAGLAGFESRLHWHCHFMQKLESEPEMEFQNLHHAHDGIRDELLSELESQRRLQAWCLGETGWPLVDACMAMLRQTGWINFRMRAMLMSTASYLYWLHWRESGLHLAREFLDYEPGIHWAQTQMQSGTTGINTLRIYSPIKQAKDQDPTGAFVRHWLPALKRVPDTWIFEPFLMPRNLQLQYGCVLDVDYPSPIVEIGQAMREARMKISAARKKEGVYTETQAIIQKHASRKGKSSLQHGASKNKEKKSKLLKINTKQQNLFE